MPRSTTNTKNKNKSNAKNKNKKKSAKSTTSNIAEMAEFKHQSEDDEDDYDEHLQSEHYLKINKSVSDAKFTDIDCLSPNEIVPLKHEAMKHPTNKQLKHNILNTWRDEHYQNWLIELKTGFNLLFYGVGSKKHVLEDFGKTYCCSDPDGIVIRVNGFDDTVSDKQILNALIKVIIDKDKKRKIKKNNISHSHDAQQKARNIVQYLEDKENENKLQYSFYYLIINNIDGKRLRKKNAQSVLSVLANCRYIHLIASMDHIHAMLLWDRTQLSLLHWIYHEITTYKHYGQEMEFEKEQTIKMGNDATQHGLQHIMESLTPNHREIIGVLAEHQMENGNGLEHDEWCLLCEDLLFVNNELSFKKYLGEFIDHKVIVENIERGTQVYTIPYDKETIEKHLIDEELVD
eukprot:44268_1